MALSMEEQRLLAEIERGLADEDPLLAARLSAFKHPGLKITLRLRRSRLLASVGSVIAVAAVSVGAYMFVPFAHHAAPRDQISPAITETGARGSPGTAQPGSQGGVTGQSGAGSSIRPASSSAPGTGRSPGSGQSPGTSGAAGTSQGRATAGSSKAGAPSRSAGNQAGRTATSTPAQ